MQATTSKTPSRLGLPGVLAALALAGVVASGCASQPKYACGVPEGVGCMPVSEVYERTLQGTLPRRAPPARGAEKDGPAEAAGAGGAPAPARPVIATVKPGDPILETPQPLRIWVARWVDRDGDLHDETYLYLRPSAARWRIEAAREAAGEGG